MKEKALEYIKNTGGNPKVEWFIEDHAPVGKMLLEDLRVAGLVVVKDGKISLVSSNNKEYAIIGEL